MSKSSFISLADLKNTDNNLSKLVHKSIQNIVDSLSDNPDQIIVVSTSGGKDSSVLCALFMLAVKWGLIDPKRLRFTFSDTKLELPTLHKHITLLFEYAKSLGIESVIVKRQKATYWTRVLGLGTFTSNWRERWCVQLLKLGPLQKYFKTLPKDHIVATGVRRSESAVRETKYKDAQQTIKEMKKTTCDTAGECFVNLEDLDNVFHPILDWLNCHIWDFIRFFYHGIPLHLLFDLYLGEDSARLGCWNCTVVSTNLVVEKMGKTDFRYKILHNIWTELKFYNKPETRPLDWIYIFRNAGRSATKDTIGMKWRPSFIRLEVRQRIFNMLIDAQEETGFELISEEEIITIKKLWETRTNNFDPVIKRSAPVKVIDQMSKDDLTKIDKRIHIRIATLEDFF